MKVLQVPGGDAFGGGEASHACISAMAERGDDVWVLCPDEDAERRFAKAGCKVVETRFWFRPVNPLSLIAFIQLLRLCRRERFDLVATHTPEGGCLVRLAACVAGVPCVVHHADGFAFRETQSRWVRRGHAVLERIAARACDLIVSTSEDHRQAALREAVAPPEKILTVLNGLDAGAFSRVSKADARRSLGFDTGDVLIGVASRLSATSGIGDLIGAFAAIHRDFRTTRLVLLGDGQARMELEAQAQSMGLGDRVHFIGFRQNFPDLLAAFDIMLQPSISEGHSYSILQAMAAGKPLVVCDIPGNREIVTHRVNGLLVPPSHPAALAAAVQWLIEHPGRAALMGTHAQADCRRRFSQERMVRQVLECYDGAADRGATSTDETACLQEA